MILGIGVDLVHVARIGQALDRFGERMKRRLFTPGEIAWCEGRVSPAQHFAVRFAAKEAFLKALGTGKRAGIPWREVEVVREDSGRPRLVLHGQAKLLCDSRGVRQALVSLTHDGEYGAAQVVLEGEG